MKNEETIEIEYELFEDYEVPVINPDDHISLDERTWLRTKGDGAEMDRRWNRLSWR
jgi:hypothetical protein